MAHISQEKLIEMEAEMDRFEQEILTPHSASDLPRVIIGSSTYNQVSAQLKKLREATGSSFGSIEERERKALEVSAQLKLLRAQTELVAETELSDTEDLLKPPPPPPPVISKSDIPFLPPPPPPPPILSGQGSTSFIPPQLRHRPPPPPPRPMMGPPRMRPPPPPRPLFGPGGGPGMGPGDGPSGPGPMGPGPNQMGPGPMGPMSGMGPGPFHGPPRGYGPMGPGPMPLRGPMRPPMHPMGPGPGPGFMGPGPNFIPGGAQEPSGGGMYGVSSGEAHKSIEDEEEEKKKDAEDDKPKAVYASAPQIVVPIEKKEKKRKRKRKEKKEEASIDNDNIDNKMEENSGLVVGAPMYVEPPATAAKVEVQEDFHVADMDIDTSVVPSVKKEKKEKKKKFIRFAAGQAWEDQTLSEWDQDDFRLFCGDLGNEVTDETLGRAFSKYTTFVRAKVVRDKRTQKTKGYGFVSFRDPNDYVRAIREMNGKYVGNRPIKLRKSTWRDRNIDVVKRKEKEKKRLGLK